MGPKSVIYDAAVVALLVGPPDIKTTWLSVSRDLVHRFTTEIWAWLAMGKA